MEAQQDGHQQAREAQEHETFLARSFSCALPRASKVQAVVQALMPRWTLGHAAPASLRDPNLVGRVVSETTR